MPRRVYLSLGSNISPEQHLPAAVTRLKSLGRVLQVSRVWQSSPAGDPHQPDFCNAAICLETELTPAELVATDGPLRQIEASLGRVRDPHNRNAARTIDIDLSLCEAGAIDLGTRRLPDPDIWRRAFVAVPLSELDGAELPDDSGPTLLELAAQLAQEQPLKLRDDIRLKLSGQVGL